MYITGFKSNTQQFTLHFRWKTESLALYFALLFPFPFLFYFIFLLNCFSSTISYVTWRVFVKILGLIVKPISLSSFYADSMRSHGWIPISNCITSISSVIDLVVTRYVNFSPQVELVDTVTFTAKGTAWTQLHWAQHSSTMDSVAALVSNSSAPMTPRGATPAAPPFLSPLPTSAHQTMLFPATMAAGATLPAPTSISPCPCSSRSLSIVPGSSPWLSAGEFPVHTLTLFLFYCVRVWWQSLLLLTDRRLGFFPFKWPKCPYYVYQFTQIPLCI